METYESLINIFLQLEYRIVLCILILNYFRYAIKINEGNEWKLLRGNYFTTLNLDSANNPANY